MPSSNGMRELLDLARRQEKDMVGLLRRFVRIESPSTDKSAVDRFGRLVAAEWRRRGARVRVLHQRRRGDHLRAELFLGRGRPRGQILVLGHLDTVYDVGTLARMPCRIARRRLWGPGAFDMKGGLVIALYAIDVLRRARLQPSRQLVFLWTSDEEIGSESSRAIIEKEARRSEAVLVLEPANGPHGHLKTGRKGVGELEILVHGRAAHAGLNPRDGVNAVHELSLQIARLMRFNHPRRGITVNADVIEGGTRTNVIAERASARVDLRVSRKADIRPLERAFRSLRPILKGARLEVRGGIGRPPLEPRMARTLFQRAKSLAHQMGMELKDSVVGGGSDGNFTAALGVPTLDGLGAVGEGAHTSHENVVIRALPERAALLAGLISTL